MNIAKFFIIFLILYFLSINMPIPGTNLDIPINDFILIIFYLIHLVKNKNKNVVPFIINTFSRLSLLILLLIPTLILLSIAVGNYFYNDIIVFRDYNSILIYLRLLLYIYAGHLWVYHYKINLKPNKIIFALLLYIGVISLLQYLYTKQINIPLFTDLALSYVNRIKYIMVRVVGTKGNPNWNSFDLNIIIAITLHLIKNQSYIRVYKLIVYWGVILLFSLLLFASLSRTGFVTYIEILVLSLILGKLKKGRKIILLSLFVIIFFVGDFFYNNNIDIIERRIEKSLKIEELGQRSEIWLIRQNELFDRFPLGVGPSKSRMIDFSDNQLLLTSSEAGVVGGILLLTLIIYMATWPYFLYFIKRVKIYPNDMFILTSLGLMIINYSITADLLKNLAPSSMIFLLYGYYYYSMQRLRGV